MKNGGAVKRRFGSAGDESASFDEATNDAKSVVKRSVGFVEDELVGAAEKNGNRLASGGRGDSGDLLE